MYIYNIYNVYIYILCIYIYTYPMMFTWYPTFEASKPNVLMNSYLVGYVSDYTSIVNG